MALQKPYTREQARKALARTIVMLRRRASVSQEELALVSGVDRSYMSGIERSLSSPTVEILVRLLPVLGVNWEQFGAEFDKQLRFNSRAAKN
jgi:transcriptional regulator with XRE-family HTH domain